MLTSATHIYTTDRIQPKEEEEPNSPLKNLEYQRQ
jgi:hypothetical protein